MMFKKLLVMLMLFSVSAAMCMERVTIQPHEGKDFKIDVKLAKLSKTIKNLIEDAGIDNPIPLPSVPGPIWEKIQEQLGRLEIIVNKIPKDQKSEAAAKKAEDEITAALNLLNGDDLVGVIAAANYLDIPDLLRLSMDVAKQVDIKKITPEQIATLPKDIRNSIIFEQISRILGKWQIKQLAELKGHRGAVYSVCVTPDGSKIVSGSGDATIRIWDIKSGNQLAELKGHTFYSVRSVYITPDGRKIVAGSDDQTIRVWDITSSKQLAELKDHIGSVSSVCVTPDGSKIVSGDEYGRILVWNMNNLNKPSVVPTGHTNSVFSVCVTPDGSKIVSGGVYGSILVWNMNNLNEPPVVLTGHRGKVLSVCVTPDGSRIVSGGEDFTIRVWEMKNLNERPVVLRDTDVVYSVCVTPDGSKIVSGSGDNTIRIWDIKSGKQLAELKGHTDYVNSVCVTPDGSKIVSGSRDNTIRVWDISLFDRLRAMNEVQTKQVWSYLQGDHKAGWDGIHDILR